MRDRRTPRAAVVGSCSGSPPRSSRARRWTIDWADTWLSPMAAYSASTSVRFIEWATWVRALEAITFCSGMPSRRNPLASSSRPVSMASSRRSRLNHCRILLRARDEATSFSQSREGPAVGALEVKISTVSAEVRTVSSGTSRPLTRAPMQRCPTSVWMA